MVGPSITDYRTWSFPNDVKLTICLDLTDQNRLGNVMVRHHGCHTARKVWYGNADDGVLNRSRIRRPRFVDRLDPHFEPDVVRFHRIIGHAIVVINEL